MLAGCAWTALALGIGGCAAASSSSVTVSGTRLTIYVSAPSQTAAPDVSQDVVDAEQLALAQAGSQTGRFSLRMVVLHGKASDNARTAIQDSTAIAYLGEVVPPSSYASLGITNAVDLLQVSPTDTALELTQPTAAVPGSPSIYYESLKTYGRTFARVVPTTALEAQAQLKEMRALHVKRLYVSDDGSAYGKAIALALKDAAAPAITVLPSESGADAVFYGSDSEQVAARFFNHAALASPTAKLFGPSALFEQTFVALLSPATRNLYISTPGFLPKDLGPAGRKFVADFTATYHRAPSVEAIFGYEAMAAVVAVLREASSDANNRATVVRDFFAIKNRDSVLGRYSINVNGDTSVAPFVISRLTKGTLVPYAFVQAQ